jgi:L-rhamnose-H+ transport protein
LGPDPAVGVVYHWIGGLAAGSFYIPFRRVRGWSWETYWLVGGVFSWIVAPWVFASLLVPGFWDLLRQTPRSVLFWAYCFGLLWGVGGLTFGLTMRYLGIALGVAIALGYCAAFGTLVPPLFSGDMAGILTSVSGRVILIGVGVCLAGIAVSGLAGMSKERELSPAEKQATIAEFSFVKGILVATVAGVMSACFAYGLAAGKPIAAAARARLIEQRSADVWQNLPVLVVVLLGGFTTNFIWCLILHARNRSGAQYLRPDNDPESEHSSSANARERGSVASAVVSPARSTRLARLANNYAFSALAGITWYLQFFFYSIGQTKMGPYDFSSWTLHMASIIIFSTLWGVALREWTNTSRRTHALIGVGLVVLIASTIIVGYGNYLKAVHPSG